MNFYGMSNEEKEAVLVNLDEVTMIVWKNGELDFYFKGSQNYAYSKFKGVTEEQFESLCKKLKELQK